MANYDSNYEIAQAISEKLGNEPIPFDSVYSICLQIYEGLGGVESEFDSVYSILLSILPLIESAGDSRLSELLATDECILTTTLPTTGATICVRNGFNSDSDVNAVVWGDGTYTETDGSTITNGDDKNTTIEISNNGYVNLIHTYEVEKSYAINLIGTDFEETLCGVENIFKSLYINKGVDIIGAYLISYQTHLEHITFNDECHTSLGNYCFCYGGNINNVYIPDGVIIAGVGQFWNTTVANFIFGCNNSITSFPDYFNYCSIDWRDWSTLSKLEIPEGVTSIGNSVFSVNSPYIGSTLKKIEIPSSVRTIGNYAFNYILDNDAVVDIPSSVTSIGNYAFYRPLYQGSGSTQDGRTTYTVICRCTTLPQLGTQVFYGSDYTPPTYCTLYVPNDVIDLYRNAPQWSEFGTILPIESMGFEVATNAEIEQMF